MRYPRVWTGSAPGASTFNVIGTLANGPASIAARLDRSAEYDHSRRSTTPTLNLRPSREGYLEVPGTNANRR